MRLSKSQKLVYDMEKYAGESSISIICGSMLLKENTPIEQMQKAVNEIYRLNDGLRIHIVEDENGVYQEITPYYERKHEVLRFETKEELDEYAEHYAKIPIDLYGALCETKIIILPDRCGVLVKLHHLVGDAWTLALLGNQLTDLLHGATPEAYSYMDHIEEEEKYIRSKRYEKDRQFFLEQFRKCTEPVWLSEDRSETFSAKRKTFVIDKEEVKKLIAYIEKENTSAFMLFTSAVAAYINRVRMNADRFYIGTAVLNRSTAKEKNTAGMFVNTAPVLVELDNTKSFADNRSKIEESAFGVLRHQKFNYGEVLANIRKEFGFGEKLFDVMLSYQNATVTGESIETTWYSCGMQTESLQIHIDDRDREGIFRIHYDYLTDRFTEENIGRIHRHIMNILFTSIEDDSKHLYELPMLTEEESEKVIEIFNQDSNEYPKNECIHQLIEHQAEKYPDQTAIVAQDASLTYEQFNEQANRIAHYLVGHCDAKPVIAVALPRKSYLLSAILGILKAGAAYMPIDPNYPGDRIQYMLHESGAQLCITEENIGEMLQEAATDNLNLAVSGEDLYCALHTSGSTGKPKMALLRHRNLRSFLAANQRFWEGVDTVVSATIVTFDAFILDSVLSLAKGCRLILAKEEEIYNQNEFEKLFDHSENNMFFATPTKLENYIRNSETKAFLTRIKNFIVGGEVFNRNLLDLIKTTTPDSRVFNIYGPTEAAICVLVDELQIGQEITIGEPAGNTQIYIVDRFMTPVPIGVTGEICIAGDCVGAGYINQPEMTAEKFIENPFGNGKLYRTGDLGYWREDGKVVYVGRNDFQVKIRGLRIELGEIENAICTVDGITQAVVVVRRNKEGRQIICAFYTGTETDAKEIRRVTGKILPQYMIPHIFTHMESLPLTTSGKISRTALPEVDLYHLDLSVEYVAPRTEQEALLVQMTEEVLKTEKISMLDNFFDLGGDSLKGIELIAKMEARGYRINTKDIFDSSTMMDLAAKLMNTEKQEQEFDYSGDIPVSAAQLRVYTAQSMSPESTTYNVPYAFKIKDVDQERLQAAIQKLILRHEILRTRFENKNGKIIQIIEENAECKVEHMDSEDISTFIRPFDLSAAPLLRVGCTSNMVVIDMHHIITDGASMPVFMQELNELYMGRELTDRVVPYKQFAVQTPDYEESEAYWLSVFKDEIPVLEMNPDFKPEQKQSFSGDAFYDLADFTLHQRILAKCKELNITPYVYYMGAFNVLLSKYSGADDVVVGMPISGRSSRFMRTIGMFVNTVALRNQPVGTKTIQRFLEEVKEHSVNAIAHQDYPYGELVKKLQIPDGRNTLFDVMFAYQSEEMMETVFGDQKAELIPVPVKAAKYDFTFNIMPREKDVVIMVEYCDEMYRKSTIQRLTDSYKMILEQFLETDRMIEEICVVTNQDKEKLLLQFNERKEDYNRELCLHHIFEEQVKNHPDRQAVIAADGIVTYEELNQKANRIAHNLLKMGVCPGDIVAFALPRTSSLIAVMFGILKAGAAYLPIDPDYPADRIEYMLDDSKAKVFIQGKDVAALLEGEGASDPAVAVTSDSLCYCIYTSGSTGKPKAVAISHANVHNFILEHAGDFQSTMKEQCDCVFATNAVVFDITVQDILFPLLNGMNVVFAETDTLTHVTKLIKYAPEGRTGLIITPTKLQMYMQSKEFCRNLERFSVIMVGAENFPPNLFHELRKYTDAVVFNGYGPTETTCGVLYDKIEQGKRITIGKPIANTQIYITDAQMRIVPIGVTGELCIAGDSVGAGYLYRPELTEEKFIPNPFGEGKVYKTGDLAYCQDDGRIVYIGRNDSQVKIRGLRIELGEIENAISSMEQIAQATVVVRKNREGRQLICAFYTGEEMEAQKIRLHIGKTLPKYMLPHIYTHLEHMPLTAGGKVNQKALPEVDLYNTDILVEYVEPETREEMILAKAAAEVLQVEKIGLLDNFFDLGGDSMRALELVSRLETEGYSVDTKTIFESNTVKDLAEKMIKAERIEETFEYEGDIPATQAQMRVYTAQGMASDSTTYNVSFVFRTEDLNPEKLQTAVDGILKRHEILRTRFENREGRIIQVVEENAVCKVVALESDDISAFIRPFDLNQAPLIRVGYYQNTVMIDIHHIVTDGSSMPVFVRELNELYMGREIPKPTVPYKMFAVQETDYSESEKYWLSVYHDEPPVLEMNTDFKAGPKQTFNGSGLYDLVPEKLHGRIVLKSKEFGITPYVFYMSAFNVMLARFSGGEDIVVGVPMSGRSSKFLDTIGMFVNTVALRSKPIGNKTVKEFLLEVKENSIQALAHQDYPYGELVKKLKLAPGGRNPLFDIMFAYQSEEMTEIIFGDKKAELLKLPITSSKYDITFSVLPQEKDVLLLAEYCTDLYRESTMKRFMESYKYILSQMLDGMKRLKDIAAITEEERRKVLYQFNETARDLSRGIYLHKIFEQQAERMPDQIAVIAPDCNLTYAELNIQANQIAHSLIDQGIVPGDIVAFALPRKSSMITVILGILKAGAVYLPVDPDYPQERIDYMLKDSDAKLFLTQVNLDTVRENDKKHNPEVELDEDALCYCIYTSGSTGKPKGTLLRHRGITNLVTDLSLYEEISECKRIGFMTTITFDVASQEIFTALLNGMTGVLMPERKETKTDTIIRNIVEHQVEVIYATTTYLDSLTNTKEKAEALASTVKICVLAGEAFAVNDHLARMEGIHFYNQYGPAETHVATAAGISSLKDIHIGKPIANTQIYIVDAFMNPVPIGVKGELCIAGECVGAGYLKRPELNREKFVKNPFGTGKLYKTGDLAFWREDGNIAYMGRNDFQVKIRGQRIELGEIESAMCTMENIEQAVVIVRKNPEGRQLICAFYTGEETDTRDIRRHISKRLPKYMIPHIFTWLNVMPLTASGKISRTALPEIDLSHMDTSVEYVAPETDKERSLEEAVCEVLGIEKAGMLDNFFDLGGDSLKGIELISRLEEAGYKADTKSIFECDTMRELAAAMKTQQQTAEEFEYEGNIPATPAQMRIYTAQSMNEDITTYNVPYIFKVAELDADRLQKAVDQMVARHDILRTWFENHDGQIIQVIEDSAACEVEKLESDDSSAFIRPFNLKKAPLLRVGYYENIVMIDMHHTITDGGSMPVFLQELNELYMGRELTSEPVQYKRFAVKPVDYSKSEEYWLSVFHDEPPVLDMNTDYKAGQKKTYNGNAIYEVVKPELYNQIVDRSKELGITPYVFYMGAFHVLLSKYSGKEDIVVGMPMSGRSGKFMNTLGMFVNTIALRNQPEGGKTVRNFLNEVKEHSVDAIAHQDYPFGELVKKLNIGTDVRNPLFDVMFAYQSEETSRIIFGDKEAEIIPMPVHTSKYDFTFNILPKDNYAVVMVEYCTDLYKKATVQRMAASYKTILEEMLDEKLKLKDISAMTRDDETRVLIEFNDTNVMYDKTECIHHLFEKQAEQGPDRTAVIACDRTLTYRQLNESANRIAHSLIDRGIKKGGIIAVALPRKSSLIAALFGVLKAGAAYVPVDPEFPKERIEYIVKDSRADMLITAENIDEMLNHSLSDNPLVDVCGEDLCYSIYTSGTTGNPKGTMICHRNFVNFCNNNRKNHQACMVTEGSRLLSTFKHCFDAFGVDYGLFLTNGRTVVLAGDEAIVSAEKLAELMNRYEVDVIHTTPSTFKAYCNCKEYVACLKKLNVVMLGAENFTPELYEFFAEHTNARVFNGYGPSETTIGVTFGEVKSEDITIGKPIANTQIYILDQYGNPVPIGVTGELCIGGDSVGQGYLNKEELTAEKFVQNPFGEGKIYKTGDLAFWREDGNVAYVGRNDFQVKIRGLRIELGEIESAMCSMEGISQAVVLVRKNRDGRQIICAFYSGEETEAKKIRLHIGKILPKYMLPHVFVYVENMPLSSSGKINRNALPEVDLDHIVNEQEYAAPKTNLQMELCRMLEELLEIRPIGISDDFFELGGDSLKAIEFVSRAHDEGVYFSLQNVFDYKTVEELAEFIENGDEQMIRFDDVDFTKIDELLSHNMNENVSLPKRKDIGSILLTGATGYLGVHVLADYLENDSGTAYCLVRGADREDSQRRLREALTYYFGNRYARTDRIEVLCADLSKERFGLEEEYDELTSKVDMVIHTAASVKHYGSYPYFYENNVETTKRIIQFCKDAGAKLIHASTLSISGTHLIDGPAGEMEEDLRVFHEGNLYIGQQLDNVYLRSKFEAEMAVLTAMTEGLQANIMRMGNLTNRTSDGMFQKNHESNAFLQKLKAILELGVCPDYLMEFYLEFTPIDEAAGAVMMLARHFSMDQTVFHISNIKHARLKQLGEDFGRLGYTLKSVDGDKFAQALTATSKQKGKEHIFNAFITELDENNQLNTIGDIYADSNYTAGYLRALGFEWSEIDYEYLAKYVAYFEKIGYLEGKNEERTSE
ncbi:MAG: amino acid adenylation domain-containing protein [Bariatricus sp.]